MTPTTIATTLADAVNANPDLAVDRVGRHRRALSTSPRRTRARPETRSTSASTTWDRPGESRRRPGSRWRSRRWRAASATRTSPTASRTCRIKPSISSSRRTPTPRTSTRLSFSSTTRRVAGPGPKCSTAARSPPSRARSASAPPSAPRATISTSRSWPINDSPDPPWVWAAQIGAYSAASLRVDPGLPLQYIGTQLKGAADRLAVDPRRAEHAAL